MKKSYLVILVAFFSLTTQAANVLTASLGKYYDLEVTFLLPVFAGYTQPTVSFRSEVHRGLEITCHTNLEMQTGVAQVRVYRAGTRQLVGSKNVPLTLGVTKSRSEETEEACSRPSEIETGVQGIGLRGLLLDTTIEGTSLELRPRFESRESLVGAEIAEEGDKFSFRRIQFTGQRGRIGSIYWDLFDNAANRFVESYQASDAFLR